MSINISNEGYRLAHTMIRVKDLEASFNFYCKTLGMKILRKTDYPSGSSQKAITLVPCFIGPGARVIFIPSVERSSQAL